MACTLFSIEKDKPVEVQETNVLIFHIIIMNTFFSNVYLVVTNKLISFIIVKTEFRAFRPSTLIRRQMVVYRDAFLKLGLALVISFAA